MNHPTEPTSYQLAILAALQQLPVYQGTVTAPERTRRRARNRAARAARRLNRRQR